MNARLIAILVAAGCLVAGPAANAQYTAPSRYFPKNFPAPSPRSQPAAPKAPATPAPTTTPTQPKFKDLSVNTQFYFLSDTNRTYMWTKISSNTATNTKNGVVQTIKAETPVQK